MRKRILSTLLALCLVLTLLPKTAWATETIASGEYGAEGDNVTWTLDSAELLTNCSKLVTITIPDNITSIGNSAFAYRSGLTSITIPDSVTSIGDYAFWHCSNLTSITIPDGITEIGKYAFGFCENLTGIILPNTLTNISIGLFTACSNLTSIYIPASVTVIDYEAFSKCDALTDIYYSGTKAQWENIDIGTGNDDLISATIYFMEGPAPDVPDTTSLTSSMTRAMVWMVLGRLSGADVNNVTPWYVAAQTWAASAGISDGQDPDGSITREQLVTMLYRQAGNSVTEADLSGFSDSTQVSDWAKPAVQWAVANGLLNGDGGQLKPTASATRAEVAAILMRFCENTAQ